MAHALYHAVNVSAQDENSTGNLNDSLVSHVIVRTGFIYYKTSLLKGFHRYWCRLYRENDIYPRQMVLYEVVKNKKEVSQFIPLDNVFKVLIDNEKYQFDIMTSTKKYSVRTTTLQEAKIWVETINQEVFGSPLPGVIYRFRVKTDRCHKCKGPIADYLLKVFDDKIQLYSSNGKIPTDFSCKLHDIHRIKCLSTNSHKGMKEFLSITIKNAQSNFIEKDILVLQAKSSGDLSKVINHRKQLIVDKLLPPKPCQASTTKAPSITPQEISSNHSNGCAAEEEIYDTPSMLQSHDTMQRELLKYKMKSFSISDTLNQPLPQSDTYSPKSGTSLRPKLYPSLSRSSQNINNSDQFSSKTLPSHLSDPADHQSKFLQVPIAMTKISQGASGRCKSASFPKIQAEDIYESVNDALEYYTVPLVNHSIIDDNDDDDDEYYVINQIDQYLEILPPVDCDKHLYENITTDVDDYEEINDADNIYDCVKDII